MMRIQSSTTIKLNNSEEIDFWNAVTEINTKNHHKEPLTASEKTLARFIGLPETAFSRPFYLGWSTAETDKVPDLNITETQDHQLSFEVLIRVLGHFLRRFRSKARGDAVTVYWRDLDGHDAGVHVVGSTGTKSASLVGMRDDLIRLLP